MSYYELEIGVEKCIEGMRFIAVNGKYRERLELYSTIHGGFDFFGNFEEEAHYAIVEMKEFLENNLEDEDIAEINEDYEA